MEKIYNHKEIENKMYQLWEEKNAFSPEKVIKLRNPKNIGEPYSILMPPPNANAPLHCGHATYAIQDLMARFKRMQGFDVCYFPGTDHAGFETQYVYENKLKKEGKSRFDYDRQTLYSLVLNFVKLNSDLAINQLKKIGISADWRRNTFMLDKKVVDRVYKTFIKMHKEGLIYRDGYMVNYSTFYGTTFSDLETEYKDSVSPLYYIKYSVKGTEESITVATVRPETIYADVAIAVNPKDNRYKKYVDKVVINPLNGREMPIIQDEYVDIDFGTGALKITPGHDINDYKIGKKHNLEIISLIDLDGKLNELAKDCAGLYPNQARVKSVEILKKKGALAKVDEAYENRVLIDYKDGRPIEPMILPNWFINMEQLSEAAIKSVENEDIKFNKKLWKNEILRWLKEKKPWPISRQTIFGISIPVWYPIEDNDNLQVTFINSKGESKFGSIKSLLSIYNLKEIEDGLQKVIVPANAKYVVSVDKPGDGKQYLPETDTFDTWFSSGQWPFTTTGFPDSSDFKKYFPTSFMDSMWDIMFFWIARMLMFSLYLTKDSKKGSQVPFKNVYFHGAIADKSGKKMSKSKGNTIDPLEFVEKYGADALRMGILVGGNTASRYSPLDEDKVRGYRNFANKIWNVARFIQISEENAAVPFGIELTDKTLRSEDIKILTDCSALVESVTSKLNKYNFKLAGEEIYEFIWNRLANQYLEEIKDRKDITAKRTLKEVFSICLKLLHPFMPFVTEAAWQELKQKGDLDLIVSNWPN
ncbi:valine--tRNA ligase [bacterium]|nr:valine--tRNA ligase [bacterium]